MSGESFHVEEATIDGIHSAMQDGIINASMIVEAYLARIEAYDKSGPAINSVIAVNPKAVEEAASLDINFAESGFTGPLHGIPILLKDNIETKDMPTTAGSLSLQGYQPDHDASIVRRFLQDGRDHSGQSKPA